MEAKDTSKTALQKIAKTDFNIIQSDFEYQFMQNGLSKSQAEARKIFQREVSFAVQHINKNPYIAECDKKTIIGAVLNVAQVGLTLNPVEKLAYLVPRRNYRTQTLECCLDPSYMGLKKLAVEAGAIKSSEEQVIYAGDKITIDLASERKVIQHIPYFLCGNEQGEIVGAYSVATLPDNRFHCELMGKRDIDKIRDKSEGWKSSQKDRAKFKSTWDPEEFEGEMCRKTVLKRHLKYLPRTQRLDNAIEYSNQAQNMRFPINYSALSYAEQLLQSSTISPEEKQLIENELGSLKYQDEIESIIDRLKENQPGNEDDHLKSISKE